MNIIESAIGRYEESGNPIEADVIVGQSFGTSTHSESPNSAIARYIMDRESGQPIIVDRTLADAFPKSRLLDVVVEGSVSNTVGTVGGSWGVLIEAMKYMEENELTHPMMVAQRYHIGRVAMQALAIGMENIIVPGELPANFDPESEQLWTRSLALWLPREAIGSIVLKRRGQL